MPTSRLTLRQLLELYPTGFNIAAYQRRYVWGQYREGENDAALTLTLSLVKAFRRHQPIFLQGITATVATRELIDGQQRITYLYLLLRYLRAIDAPSPDGHGFALTYDARPLTMQWLAQPGSYDFDLDPDEPVQDIYFCKKTLRTIDKILSDADIDFSDFAAFVLDNIYFLYIGVDDDSDAIPLFKMMNGTKARMLPADIIKADLIRLATDHRQPNSRSRDLEHLASRYADEWCEWQMWWQRRDVQQYYNGCTDRGIDMLLTLAMTDINQLWPAPTLTHESFCRHILAADDRPYHAAKHFFDHLRRIQRRFCDAFVDPVIYNRIQAILLLQRPDNRLKFLHMYFVGHAIDAHSLEVYYKLSFLGMTIDEIASGTSAADKFDDLYASLSMADVYHHSDSRRDAMTLLLRLNIDEDIKLGRRFDFSIWGNRSLEHIYSKSKVWHIGADGHVYDGNDNRLPGNPDRYRNDKSYMCRDSIRGGDGLQLSEHCIGNLVLLYGQNNAAFGNAGFDEKKMMFLSPGDRTVFQSRNLLHSVCVFAGNRWDNRSIADNYALILKNLRSYYGY